MAKKTSIAEKANMAEAQSHHGWRTTKTKQSHHGWRVNRNKALGWQQMAFLLKHPLLQVSCLHISLFYIWVFYLIVCIPFEFPTLVILPFGSQELTAWLQEQNHCLQLYGSRHTCRSAAFTLFGGQRSCTGVPHTSISTTLSAFLFLLSACASANCAFLFSFKAFKHSPLLRLPFFSHFPQTNLTMAGAVGLSLMYSTPFKSCHGRPMHAGQCKSWLTTRGYRVKMKIKIYTQGPGPPAHLVFEPCCPSKWSRVFCWPAHSTLPWSTKRTWANTSSIAEKEQPAMPLTKSHSCSSINNHSKIAKTRTMACKQILPEMMPCSQQGLVSTRQADYFTKKHLRKSQHQKATLLISRLGK